MNRYCQTWIQEWCEENGWTDLFVERRDYWAFPPHAVIPMPIPNQVLQRIKANKGMSPEEKIWGTIACLAAIAGAGLSYWLHSPMPLMAAFSFCAITVARFEED